MSKAFKRPTWAPRVPRAKIWRLYHLDAQGIRDEELADDVGLRLLARIESCLVATNAHEGLITCPDCGNVEKRKWDHGARKPDEVIRCASCGWEITWREFHKASRNKHLQSRGLETFFKDFAAAFPKARSYQEKMILIDTLLHRYHWQLEGELGGPGAVNLIGGTRDEVLAFLNGLTYGTHTTDGLEETQARWREMCTWAEWNEGKLKELLETHRREARLRFEEHDGD